MGKLWFNHLSKALHSIEYLKTPLNLSENVFSVLHTACTECNTHQCRCLKTNILDKDIDMTKPIEQDSKTLSLQRWDSSTVNFKDSTILNGVSAYNADTITENDISSVDSLYYVSTVCNSTVHDLNVSPLSAHGNLTNLGLRGKGMHIGHLNVRGIRSGEKFDQIRIMLRSEENDISMLGLSESKLGCEVPDSFYQIENFQCFRKDKVQGSGGLLIYVKNDVSCKRREDLEHVNFESVWLEVFPKCSKSFLVGHFYRNPQSNITWNETFDD